MRSSKSRSRSKSNRPRSMGNVINRVFDSSGPEGKVRGTPQQIIDKYLILARDAQLSNDRVAAENFMQHAEHYTRMLGEAMREMGQTPERRDEDDRPEYRQDNGRQPDNRNEGRQDNRGDGRQDNRNEGRQNDNRQDNRQQDNRQNDGRQDNRQQDNRQQDNRQQDGRQQDGRQQDGRQQDGRQQEPRQDDRRGDQRHQPRRDHQDAEPAAASVQDAAPADVIEVASDDHGLVDTPEANPKRRAPRRSSKPRAEAPAEQPALFDQPAEPAADAPAAEEGAKPKRRTYTRKPKAPADETKSAAE